MLTVRDGARFKYKLMGVMVYFLPAKNKQQSVIWINFLDTNNCKVY
jgi:hypothetical protein